jgi:hypothetical protein
MKDLRDLIDIVRESRNYTNAVFPLPDVDSCIDYALTEAGEHIKALRAAYINEAIVSATDYLDAVLRERRNGDKRNTDRKHTPRSEWGQCGYMIASAIIQEALPALDDGDWMPFCDKATVYSVIRQGCDIREDVSDAYTPSIDMLDSWQWYAGKMGWNPADLLRETCVTFELKHMGQVFTAQGEVVGGA